MGHVRDLPPSADEILRLSRGKMGQFGVNVDADFEPMLFPRIKREVVTTESASGRRTGASH